MLDLLSLIAGGAIGFIASIGITWFAYYLQKKGKVRSFSKFACFYDLHDTYRIDFTFDFVNESLSPKTIRDPRILWQLRSEKSPRSGKMYARNGTKVPTEEKNVNIFTYFDLFDEISIIEISPRSTVRKTVTLTVSDKKSTKNQFLDKYDDAKISVKYLDEKGKSKIIKSGKLSI